MIRSDSVDKAFTYKPTWTTICSLYRHCRAIALLRLFYTQIADSKSFGFCANEASRIDFHNHKLTTSHCKGRFRHLSKLLLRGSTGHFLKVLQRGQRRWRWQKGFFSSLSTFEGPLWATPTHPFKQSLLLLTCRCDWLDHACLKWGCRNPPYLILRLW